MKTHFLKLLHLKQLYESRACGEQYAHILSYPQAPAPRTNNLDSQIKNCSLCNRIKHCKEPIVGFINPQARLCFISEIPLILESGEFIQNKSALMLEKIISNVFGLHQSEVSILSLIKCDAFTPHFEKSEILSCMGHIIAQIKSLSPRVYVLLGDVVGEHILGTHLEHGRILWHNNAKFLVTHSLSELVRNPSLKAQAHNDFLTAKGQL